jgi:RimJ/RimL family protein N-acetyltransferase
VRDVSTQEASFPAHLVLGPAQPGDDADLDATPDPFDVDPDPRPLPGAAGAQGLSVREDGVLVGRVSWHPVPHGPQFPCVALNIGITLLEEHRGRGLGTAAQRLLVAHLFATTDVHRIEASTDVDNTAEQRALAKVGFRREGVLRGAQLRGGARRDLVLCSLLRGELG